MPKLDTIEAGQALPERVYTATNVSLFMYNAAIWNPHRIHYDERYTTEVEGHPGVVIDGPLQGDWLTQVVADWIGTDAALASFEYSNRKAAYLGQTLTAGGEVREIDRDGGTVTVTLHVRDETGDVTTPGSAVIRFGV